MKKEKLTDMENKILKLKLENLEDKEIGKMLGVSHHTVKAVFCSILRKFRTDETNLKI